MSTITTALVGLFCTIVTSIITFILTKKKYYTEVESKQIQNLNDAFDTYKKTMKETFESQNERIRMLEKENAELKQQVSQLQEQMVSLVTNLLKEAGQPKSKIKK